MLLSDSRDREGGASSAGILTLIFEDPRSRALFWFLVLNFAFMFVELAYGFWTNSLGLISDGFHMMFDCAGLGVGLFCVMLAKNKPNEQYSYGYGRAKVVGGFVNGLFLVFVSVFLFVEAASRLLHPPHIHSEKLMVVAVLGFLVNLVGLFFFHDHAHGAGEGGCDHDHDENLHGVFLHILADTVSSIGVIISTWLVQAKGWMMADPLVSVFMAALILWSVLPLIRSSGSIMLQVTPPAIQSSVDNFLRTPAVHVEGLADCRDAHFWTLGSGVFVGSVNLIVRNDADEQQVLTDVQTKFAEMGVRHMTVQVAKHRWTATS